MQFCEQCNKPNPDTTNRFCSIRCRNTYNSRSRKPKGRITKKTCPICGKSAYRIGEYCSRHMPKLWTKDRDEYLRVHYPHKGPEQIAKELGLTYEQILSRTSILKITLTKEMSHKIIHSKASEYMSNNNPMKKDSVKQQRKEFYNANPEKKERMVTKLFEGHRKLEKSKPSKLELRLFAYLAKLGVVYESHYLVKPRFIVDVRIDNLIIQADGDYWHGHPRFEPLTDRQKAQQKRDKAQDKYLTSCGYIVERIWEQDMSYECVIQVLKKHRII